jgi:hypothetical protein
MEPEPHVNSQLLAASISHQNEAITPTTTQHSDLQRPRRPGRTAKYRIGLVVAISMAAGLIAVLVAIPVIPAKENGRAASSFPLVNYLPVAPCARA